MPELKEELNNDNYYERTDIMSASQFKDFYECQAKAYAKYKGLYKPPDSRALIIGGYMDAMWDSEEEYDTYKFLHHKDLYTKTGTKRADIQAADEAFKRAASDEMFCSFMDGEHQGIYTGTIAGVPFKGKLDSYFPGDKIVDLKYMANMDPCWIDGEKKTFIDKFHYDIQLAVYQQLIAQHEGSGELLPCYIACITKETTPQIAIIEIPQWKLNSALELVKFFAPKYQEIKEGLRAPKRCEHCDYCRSTYKIEKPISYEDLLIA